MKVTIGQMIDQLTICNLRVWMLEDKKRDQEATDQDIAEATKKTNVLNCQRNDLIQAIDEEMNEIAKGHQQKLYKQGSTKMYGKND